MKNRFIILLLSFSILCISIFALPLSIVYATDSYGYTYEEAVDIVNKHNIIYSNEGTPMFIYSSASQLWSAPRYFFTNTYTDKELVDILSSDNVIQYAVTKAKYESISSQLCKALGYATKGASTLVTDMVAKDNRQFAKGTYSDDDGYSLVADSVDKLREQLKKQYNTLIGLDSYPCTQNTSVKDYVSSSKFRNMFEHEEDYTDSYSRFIDYDYCIADYYNNFAFFFNGTDIDDFFYVSNSSSDRHLFGGDRVWNEYKIYKYNNNNVTPLNMSFSSAVYSGGRSDDSSQTFLYSGFSMFSVFGSEHRNGHSYSFTCFYKKQGLKDFEFFKSYESLYNYLHGSQTAYLSSKVEQTGEDIKISIDDMNTNISDKMDELIDSINNKKDGMSADELQKAIDKGLESLSGKMDDIKDNTQETNTKLDSLLGVMQSQNDILMNILGVTTDIYNVVSSKDKEDGSSYTIADLQPHFNKCFTAVKNMVLYGVSSFDDVDTQAVDNDVGISVVSVDSSYIMSDTGLIDVIGGRSYYKTTSGSAYVCTFKHNGWWGPLLVSENANSVSYDTCGKTFTYNCTVEYASKTWYVSSDEYSMGNYPSQTGFARVLSSEPMSNSSAALLLLKTAGVTDTPVVSPDYPEDVVKDYHNGLLGKFPFSVPYQLYEWLQVLQAEPKTPEFSYDYGFMLKYFGVSDVDTVIKFDLSQYDEWAKNARSFLKLSFTLALAVGTYRKFKGEL